MEKVELKNNKYNAIREALHINSYLLAKNSVKNKRVLDVACGEGYGTHLLSKWGTKEVVGIDISERSIKKAKGLFEINSVKFKRVNAEDLSCFKDDYFDVVVSHETIEHLNEPNIFLNEIKRVSKKNATIIISCPNDHFYYPKDNEANPFHTKKYTYDEFFEMAKSILGEKVKSYVGTYASGYVNLRTDDIDNKPISNQSLNNKVIESIMLPADFDIKINNVCYYIGIWNGNGYECSTIYPSGNNESMVMQKELLEENGILRKICNNRFEKDENDEKNPKELERYKLVLQSLESENQLLKENINRLLHRGGNGILKRCVRKTYRIAKPIAKKILKPVINIVRKKK